MTSLIFVYGTLRTGGRNGILHTLAREPRFVGYGWIRGRLYDLGPYPGLVASDAGGWVRGEIHALPEPLRSLARLDEYEGCGPNDPGPHPFERVERDVVLDDGKTTRAWVYEYRGSVAGLTELPPPGATLY